MVTQHQVNQKQYQTKSEAYLNSAVHAQGDEFAKMQNLIQQHDFKRVLDLGCGGGHVSYQVAPIVEQVIAYDITPEMVNLVTTQSQQKGFDHVIGQVGAAEQLDFPAEHFDCVISRYSAHHWQNITLALHEIYRVLRSDGKAIIFDIIGNSNPVLDTFIQTIEMIRDPSHVRNYNVSEWVAFVEQVGFKVEIIEKQSLALNFRS